MGMDVAERAPRAQVALAIAEQVFAAVGQRHPMADRGHRVLQHALAAHVHVYVACGQRDELQVMREGEQGVQAGLVVLFAMQLHCEMRALAEHRVQPAAFIGIGLRSGTPQRE